MIVQQGFPQIQAPIGLTPDGVPVAIDQAWLQLFISMWLRTGQGQGVSIQALQDEIRLQVSNQLDGIVMALQQEIESLQNQVATMGEALGAANAAIALLAPPSATDVLSPVAPPTDDFPLAPPSLAEMWQRSEWTPALSGVGGAPVGATFALQSGVAYRYGPFLYVQGEVQITALGAGGAGDLIVTGLDWVPVPDQRSVGSVRLDLVTLTAGYTWVTLQISNNAGATRILFQEQGTNVNALNVQWAALAVNAFVRFSALLFVP